MIKSNGHVLTSRTHSLDQGYDEGTHKFIGWYVARQVNSIGAQEMQAMAQRLISPPEA